LWIKAYKAQFPKTCLVPEGLQTTLEELRV